eukprot:Nitzschia sp. Nitz4//scaffold376_size14603//12927//14524//NITZ4_008923-RA/size14603-augustus-gene-0.15-mRNA-1//1//CDS//3329549667//2777//frame0
MEVPDEFSKAGVPSHRFPETSEEADKIEQLVEESIRKMRMDEHEKIMFDVHGFTQYQEDPKVVDSSVEELESELNKIDAEAKQAYLLAISKNEEYVRSRRFRLIFLRYSNFDVKAAAKKIQQHFEVKRELFGDGDILARDVRQSDLSEADKLFLDAGKFRILPIPDLAGRTVVIVTSPEVKPKPNQSLVGSKQRVLFYMTMKALQDDGAQINGTIWVTIMGSKCVKLDVEDLKASYRVSSQALPLKPTCGHFCYSNVELRPYMAGFQRHAEASLRPRTLIHFGTQEEIVFKLQTYGISAETIKFNPDGTLDLADHTQWVEAIKQQEEAEEKGCIQAGDDSIIVPSRADVLFGKTKFARNNPGTVRALFLVDQLYDEYERLDKHEKTSIAEKIIGEIEKAGGSFLRQVDGGLWVAVDQKEARRKVAHWFRHRRAQRMSSPDDVFGETGISSASPDSYPELERSAAAKRVSPLGDEGDATLSNLRPSPHKFEDFDFEPRAIGPDGSFVQR